MELLEANTQRAASDSSPDYQRESAALSIEKKQLLIDSLLNSYDIPKLYLHDFSRDFDERNSVHGYAIVDGKQRLFAI